MPLNISVNNIFSLMVRFMKISKTCIVNIFCYHAAASFCICRTWSIFSTCCSIVHNKRNMKLNMKYTHKCTNVPIYLILAYGSGGVPSYLDIHWFKFKDFNYVSIIITSILSISISNWFIRYQEPTLCKHFRKFVFVLIENIMAVQINLRHQHSLNGKTL